MAEVIHAKRTTVRAAQASTQTQIPQWPPSVRVEREDGDGQRTACVGRRLLLPSCGPTSWPPRAPAKVCGLRRPGPDPFIALASRWSGQNGHSPYRNHSQPFLCSYDMFPIPSQQRDLEDFSLIIIALRSEAVNCLAITVFTVKRGERLWQQF